MTIALNRDTITATGVRLLFSGVAGTATAIEVQISPRPDFAWCVCPVFSVAVAANATIAALNQRQSYYARARAVLPSGVEQWSNVVGFRTSDGTAQVTAPQAVMIEPAIIMLPVRPIAITPTVSSGVAEMPGYPAANLLRDAPVAWRSYTTTATYSIDIETAGEPIDTVALLMTNLPESATWRVRGDNDAPGGVGVFNFATTAFRASANLPGRVGYHGLVSLGATYSARYIRITVFTTTEALPGNILHAEHLVVGSALRSKNHAIERKESFLDLGSLDRGRDGTPARVSGLKMRRAEFELANMTEAQYETLYGRLFRQVGDTEPLLVVPNSRRNGFFHDRVLYGTISGGSSINTYSPLYSRSFVIDSLI